MKARVAVAQSGSDESAKRDSRDIASAATAFATLGKLRAAVKRALVAKLLALYNDNWRDRRTGPTMNGNSIYCECSGGDDDARAHYCIQRTLNRGILTGET
jgi:hypothetical protein